MIYLLARQIAEITMVASHTETPSQMYSVSSEYLRTSVI